MSFLLDPLTFAVIGAVSGIVGMYLGIFTARDLVRSRRAQTSMDFTKQHREIWWFFYDRKELHGFLDPKRDMERHKMTLEEKLFAGDLVNFLRATFYARRAKIHIQPEKLGLDIMETFSLPGPRLFWKGAKKYHDKKFVAFVEKNIRG